MGSFTVKQRWAETTLDCKIQENLGNAKICSVLHASLCSTYSVRMVLYKHSKLKQFITSSFSLKSISNNHINLFHDTSESSVR